MKRLAYMLMILLVLAAVAACGGNGEPLVTPPPPTATQAQMDTPAADAPVAEAAPAGDTANGQQIFSTTCSACHGPAGEGVQGLGKDMTESEFIAGLSDDELVAFIKEGRRVGDPLNTTGIDMPPKGGNPALSDEELVDIVAYIRSIHVN